MFVKSVECDEVSLNNVEITIIIIIYSMFRRFN